MTIRSIEEVYREASLWRDRLLFGGDLSREVLNPLQTWLAEDDRHGPALRRPLNFEPILAAPQPRPRSTVPPPTKEQLADPSVDTQVLAWQWVLWRYFAPRFDERRDMEAVLEAWAQRDPCHDRFLDAAYSTLLGYLRLKSQHIQMQAPTAPVPDITQLTWQEIVVLLQTEAAIAKAIRVLRQQTVPEWITVRAKSKRREKRDAVQPDGQIESASPCDDGKLADDSLVQFDKAGEAQVLISPSYRQIWLLRGAMHLDTAETDPSWPIYVYVGQWCFKSTEFEALMRIEDDVIEVDVQRGALSLFRLDAAPDQPAAHCPLPMPAASATEELQVQALRHVRCSGKTFSVHAITTREESLRIVESMKLRSGTQTA
jgi:hypothetical protein